MPRWLFLGFLLCGLCLLRVSDSSFIVFWDGFFVGALGLLFLCGRCACVGAGLLCV